MIWYGMIWYDTLRYATIRYIYIYIYISISLCVFGSSTPKYIGSPRIWAVACPEFCILELGLWTTSARALLGNSSCPSACSPTSQSPLFAHLSLSLPFPFPLAQVSTKTPYVLSNLVFLLQPSVHPARATKPSAPAWWRTYAVAAALPGPTWRVCDGNPTWQRPRWWDLRWWFANTSPVPLILNTPGKKTMI